MLYLFWVWNQNGGSTYHVSCEPMRIFWNDDTTCSTWVSCVLPTTGWIPGFSACSGQHAWHSCRAGCIVISENPGARNSHCFGNLSELTNVQPYHSKGLGESFPLMWLNIGLSWKIRERCVFWVFFKVGLCSAVSFKRSRRVLSIDVAEHRSILKNKGKMRIFCYFSR